MPILQTVQGPTLWVENEKLVTMKKNAIWGLLCMLMFQLNSFGQTCDASVTLTSPLPIPDDLVLCSDGSDAYPYSFPAPSFGSSLPDGALILEITSGGTSQVVALDGMTTTMADATSFEGVTLAPGDEVCAVGVSADYAEINTLINLAGNQTVCLFILGLPQATCDALTALSAAGGVQSITQLLGAASALGGTPISTINDAYTAMAAVEATAAANNLGFCFDATATTITSTTFPDPNDPTSTVTVYDVTPDFCWTVEACPIPTMGEWALICMTLIFMSIGLVTMREKSKELSTT